jgi:hypothetical protein
MSAVLKQFAQIRANYRSLIWAGRLGASSYNKQQERQRLAQHFHALLEPM